MIVTITPNNFPSNGVLSITIPKYWPTNVANTTGILQLPPNCISILNT